MTSILLCNPAAISAGPRVSPLRTHHCVVSRAVSRRPSSSDQVAHLASGPGQLISYPESGLSPAVRRLALATEGPDGKLLLLTCLINCRCQKHLARNLRNLVVSGLPGALIAEDSFWGEKVIKGRTTPSVRAALE